MSANTHENDHVAAVPLGVQQIDAFWSDFSDHLPRLEALEGAEFVEQANALLQPYAPELSIELEGRLKEPGGKLVFTAHGNIEQFENVQALVRNAPQGVSYGVQAFRNRTLNPEFSMGMQGFELSCTDVLVAHYDAGGILGLELSFSKDIPAEMQEHARHMAFILLDHVLGEWDFSVRVGPIEFAESSEQVDGRQPLSQFPSVFDAFQRDTLGRSYDYPQQAQDRWISLEVRARDADEDEVPDLLTFHDSANALATRADLPHFLTWRLPFSSQETLDSVRDAHDALDAELQRLQRGIQAFARMEGMQWRTVAFYVDDPDYAMQLANRLGAEHAPGLKAELHVAYDPSWREYLGLYGAIHRNQREWTEDAA
ncbi:MAG: hypothetical protein RR943_13105 [Comamonas sp.]